MDCCGLPYGLAKVERASGSASHNISHNQSQSVIATHGVTHNISNNMSNNEDVGFIHTRSQTNTDASTESGSISTIPISISALQI